METALIPTLVKNKSNKQENQWTQSHTHPPSETIERSHPQDKDKIHLYLLAYLALEKNVLEIIRKCKKMEMRVKRQAVRKISEFIQEGRQEKSHKNGLVQSNPEKKIKNKEIKIQQHPRSDSQGKGIKIICFKQCQLYLENLVHLLQTLKSKTVLAGWSSIKTFKHSFGDEGQTVPHKSSLYAQEKKKDEGEQGMKSRLSNKRKTTKGREDHKENSRLSSAQFSLENQRLRHQLMQEEQQREAFMQQFGDLLEHHEKYLTQGSTTNRTKKAK